MSKVSNKDTRPTPYFTPCSSVSIVNSEQANADSAAAHHFKVATLNPWTPYYPLKGHTYHTYLYKPATNGCRLI